MPENVIFSNVYGKVKNIMTSDGMYNLIVSLCDNSDIHVKAEMNNEFKIGYIYKMKLARNSNSEKNVYFLASSKLVMDLDDIEEIDMVYRLFDKQCPYTREELINGVESYLSQIDNKIIYDITKAIIEENKELFYIYPAAQRFHHNYVGGLAYHTLGMLNLAKSFLLNYPYLNKNYLYSGIILHDLGKIKEFTGVENTEYALEGQLLGHLVIGGMKIFEVAKKLGYENSEEALILEHIVISHHGQPLFGACKKPQTAEAQAIWFIDTIDSKFRVLGEELKKTETGKFTEPIGVMDKIKFYKTK